MKKTFEQEARNYGVKAGYSGTERKMIVSGEDKKVKSFIRLQCLKGKGHWPFQFGQASNN